MVEDELVALATTARERAYAPYSRFRVGAALVAGSGRTYTGANVENASYSHTLCAERVAIVTAIAAGETKILSIAVVTDADPPASPCGACRQVIHEFGTDATVIYANLAGTRVRTTIGALLPAGFDPAVLLGR